MLGLAPPLKPGGPFDGAGRGRAWPLLSGERGHYELAAGRDPLPGLRLMAEMVGRCGLIPEQVWDETTSPRPWLKLGQPTGSAMPLVWAHAEFVKLAASRELGRPFDRPQAVWQRYRGRRPAPSEALWSPRAPIAQIRGGHKLWLCLSRPARVITESTAGKRRAMPRPCETGWRCTSSLCPRASWRPGRGSTSPSSGWIAAHGKARITTYTCARKMPRGLRAGGSEPSVVTSAGGPQKQHQLSAPLIEGLVLPDPDDRPSSTDRNAHSGAALESRTARFEDRSAPTADIPRHPRRVAPAPQTYPSAARTRPATTRTPLGAARQTANADSTEQPIATQNASV